MLACFVFPTLVVFLVLKFNGIGYALLLFSIVYAFWESVIEPLNPVIVAFLVFFAPYLFPVVYTPNSTLAFLCCFINLVINLKSKVQSI